MKMTTLYKGFTHDLRSPVQGGEPVWDGSLPHTLSRVTVDESSADCGVGWNACRTIEHVIKIAGMWTRVYRFEVEDGLIIERGDKCRAATGTLVEEVGEATIADAIRAFTAPWAGDLTEEMFTEQMHWRRALLRSGPRDEAAVEAGLRAALEARGLKWQLQRFDFPSAAWAPSAPSAARAAWAAWAARAAWAAWEAWAARAAWAAWAASAPSAAWAASAAMTVYFAARKGWIASEPDLLTVGIRDAYYHGLGLVVPVAENVLGWAMEDE